MVSAPGRRQQVECGSDAARAIDAAALLRADAWDARHLTDFSMRELALSHSPADVRPTRSSRRDEKPDGNTVWAATMNDLLDGARCVGGARL